MLMPVDKRFGVLFGYVFVERLKAIMNAVMLVVDTLGRVVGKKNIYGGEVFQ